MEDVATPVSDNAPTLPPPKGEEKNTQILIIGAGPTGLVLALWLNRLGIGVRIIDKAAAPGTTSRAMVVQARILEFYDQIGIAHDVVAQGLPLTRFDFWVRGRKFTEVPFGDFGQGMSPFPFVLVLPQDQHEHLLIAELEKRGVTVERETELVDFSEDANGVQAQLKKADGSVESCAAKYLCGCDGAHSVLREKLHAGFPGGTYQQIFFVADVEAAGAIAGGGEMNVCLQEKDICLVFPLKRKGNVRLIGIVPPDVHKELPEMIYDDVARAVATNTRLGVTKVHWFSTYHVHYRVAQHFRIGRAFLLGDAAHIHSPAGGQGMNTGIGDAVNLAWKLAAVVHGKADEKILHTYESERMAFARRLVATTDRFFRLIANNSQAGRIARLWLIPLVSSVAMRTTLFRRFAFRTISQLIIRYPGSELSAGRAGRLRGGDRLPWMGDNYASLASCDWQLHVYGKANDVLKNFCKERCLALHEFTWTVLCEQKGFARDALYLIRPDGYIAFADARASADRLQEFFTARGLR